jgi:hypothetical protein
MRTIDLVLAVWFLNGCKMTQMRSRSTAHRRDGAGQGFGFHHRQRTARADADERRAV